MFRLRLEIERFNYGILTSNHTHILQCVCVLVIEAYVISVLQLILKRCTVPQQPFVSREAAFSHIMGLRDRPFNIDSKNITHTLLSNGLGEHTPLLILLPNFQSDCNPIILNQERLNMGNTDVKCWIFRLILGFSLRQCLK